MAKLYNELQRRKSFHNYGIIKNKMTKEQIDEVERFLNELTPLYKDIGVTTRIVSSKELKGGKGEYCVLFYSEEKGQWLRNIGYMGQQLELFLTSKNLGPLWLGLGKPDIESIEGKRFVIMMAMAIRDEDSFRKGMDGVNRKPLSETWTGALLSFSDILRFAPSACNNQPWLVKNEDGVIKVFRHRDRERFGLMSGRSMEYFPRIDMGIYQYELELCLEHNEIEYERKLFDDDGNGLGDFLNAEYYLKNK